MFIIYYINKKSNMCFLFLGLDTSDGYPGYVLAIHSSKRVAVEQITAPASLLVDSLVNLCLAKGQRHEGRQGMTVYYLTKVITSPEVF